MGGWMHSVREELQMIEVKAVPWTEYGHMQLLLLFKWFSRYNYYLFHFIRRVKFTTLY